MKSLLLMLALLPLTAYADEAAIRNTLAERNPNLKIERIGASPVAGVFEIVTKDKRIFYTDGKADYVFAGPLIETATRANLTEQRMEALNMVHYASLPFDKSIPVVRGNGARKLAVFTDPDCPYCQQLEKELALLNDITVYVFLYPIASLHPDAEKHAKAIWCAPDRAKSWAAHMLEGKPQNGDTQCKNPVDALVALGNGLGIAGTPTLVFPNGKRVSGAQSAGQLDTLLKANAIPDKKQPGDLLIQANRENSPAPLTAEGTMR